MSREVALGWASWTSFASSCPSCSSTAVQRTLSLWLCPAQQLKEQLRSAQVAGQWRGDTALTLPLFWRRSTVSTVFFGRFPRSSLSLSRPLSLIGHLASVDVKQHERTKTGILSATGLHALKIPDCSGKVLALQNVKQTLVYVLLNVSYSCFITYYIRQTAILQCMYIETSVT